MKPIWWVAIILSATIIPISLIILITRVILEPHASWWWTGGTLIIYFIVGIIVGTVLLVLKLKKKKPVKLVIDPKDAEERAKMKLKYDNDNPDNFKREDRLIMRVGQAGTERTPVLWLKGKGSETKQKIDAIINLNNPKHEIEFIYNKKDDYIKECIRLIAENPEEQITEEKEVGIDEFGRPVTRIKTKRTSVTERKKEEEVKKAQEMEAF